MRRLLQQVLLALAFPPCQALLFCYEMRRDGLFACPRPNSRFFVLPGYGRGDTQETAWPAYYILRGVKKRRVFSESTDPEHLLGAALLVHRSLMIFPQDGAVSQRGTSALLHRNLPSLFPFSFCLLLWWSFGLPVIWAGRSSQSCARSPRRRRLRSAVVLGFVGRIGGSHKPPSALPNGACTKTEAERCLPSAITRGRPYPRRGGAVVFASSRVGVCSTAFTHGLRFCVGNLFRFYKAGSNAGSREGRAPPSSAPNGSARPGGSITASFLSTLNICPYRLLTVVIGCFSARAYWQRRRTP